MDALHACSRTQQVRLTLFGKAVSHMVRHRRQTPLRLANSHLFLYFLNIGFRLSGCRRSGSAPHSVITVLVCAIRSSTHPLQVDAQEEPKHLWHMESFYVIEGDSNSLDCRTLGQSSQQITCRGTSVTNRNQNLSPRCATLAFVLPATPRYS